MDITVIQSTPSPYAIAILASLAVGFLCVGIILKKNKVPGMIIFLSIILNVSLTIYCGVLFSLITSLIVNHKVSIGLSSLGGVIGILIGVGTLTLIFRKDAYPLMKGYTLTLALIYAISKIGCLLSGCCSGREYHGFGCVTYHGEAQHIHPYPVFPVPLLESIVFIILFIVFAILFKKIKTTTMLIVYSIAKFAMDFLREAHNGVILSTNQIVCIIIAISCIVVIIVQKRRNKKRTS